MKTKIKIAITAMICLFLLSPSIFACHNCTGDPEHLQTTLQLVIPIKIFVIPDYNAIIPVVVQGGYLVDPFFSPPAPPSNWWSYNWTVQGSEGFNCQLDLPGTVTNGVAVINDGEGVTIRTLWLYNSDYSAVSDGDVRQLIADPGEDVGEVEFRLYITRVDASPTARIGLHTINQAVSAVYYNL
jgi:hypothetical protein